MSEIADYLSFRSFVLRRKQFRRRRVPASVRRTLRAAGLKLSEPPATAAAASAPPPVPIPRIVWSYWNDGEDAAPPLVQRCFRSWRDLNPGWELRVLDDASLRTFADVDDMRPYMTVQALSDMIRLRLLKTHGGVWADATLLCVLPLDDWLPEAAASGFFAFHRPPTWGGPERLIGSWFLAAGEASPFIAAWERTATALWRVRKRAIDYFWMHYMFEWMVERNPEMRATWLRTPRISAEPAHYVQAWLKNEPPAPHDEAFALAALEGRFPVQKLTHRLTDGLARLEALEARLPAAARQGGA